MLFDERMSAHAVLGMREVSMLGDAVSAVAARPCMLILSPVSPVAWNQSLPARPLGSLSTTQERSGGDHGLHDRYDDGPSSARATSHSPRTFPQATSNFGTCG